MLNDSGEPFGSYFKLFETLKKSEATKLYNFVRSAGKKKRILIVFSSDFCVCICIIIIYETTNLS